MSSFFADCESCPCSRTEPCVTSGAEPCRRALLPLLPRFWPASERVRVLKHRLEGARTSLTVERTRGVGGVRHRPARGGVLGEHEPGERRPLARAPRSRTSDCSPRRHPPPQSPPPCLACCASERSAHGSAERYKPFSTINNYQTIGLSHNMAPEAAEGGRARR